MHIQGAPVEKRDKLSALIGLIIGVSYRVLLYNVHK